MKQTEVLAHLRRVKHAKEVRSEVLQDIGIGINTLMRRVLHEAVANRMSPEQIADATGYTPLRIRDWLSTLGLDPSLGKTVLSRNAAAALATNSELLMIEPDELLMSPLAYLPMGKRLKRELENAMVSQVDESEVSGNRGFFDRIANATYNAMPWEGETYQAAAENIAIAVLTELGLCVDGNTLPCDECGRGL
jgi:hypothetical protein